mgnify:CR=1 FL=1
MKPLTARLLKAAPFTLALLALPLTSVRSQSSAAPAMAAAYDSATFAALKWREIGPFRGGRSVAVAGSAARPYEYYQGTTGGGVFKTTDGGMTWTAVTDNYFGGSIGWIDVSSVTDIAEISAEYVQLKKELGEP